MKAKSGKIIYKTDNDDHPIEVRENKSYRWLYFGDNNIQTALDLNDPSALTLAYMQPMLGFRLFKPQPENICLLGLGGGSLVRVLHHDLPQAKLSAVEISDTVIQVAKDYFQLPEESEHFKIIHADAQQYLKDSRQRIDIILCDMALQNSAPSFLYDADFYHTLKQRLTNSGIMVMNLICNTPDDFLRATQVIRSVFDNQTLVLAVPNHMNVVIYAFRDADYSAQINTLIDAGKLINPKYDLEFGAYVDAILWA